MRKTFLLLGFVLLLAASSSACEITTTGTTTGTTAVVEILNRAPECDLKEIRKNAACGCVLLLRLRKIQPLIRQLCTNLFRRRANSLSSCAPEDLKILDKRRKRLFLLSSVEVFRSLFFASMNCFKSFSSRELDPETRTLWDHMQEDDHGKSEAVEMRTNENRLVAVQRQSDDKQVFAAMEKCVKCLTCLDIDRCTFG